MRCKVVGWVLVAWLLASEVSAQTASPDTVYAGIFDPNTSYLPWALVWIGLAAGLCVALFKLYSRWPHAERQLVVATLVAMPPVSTELTTMWLPLVGWLRPTGLWTYGFQPPDGIFAFWALVAACFGTAWWLVKTRTAWLAPPPESANHGLGSSESEPDAWATRVVAELTPAPAPAPSPAAPKPRAQGAGAEATAIRHAKTANTDVRTDKAPARSSEPPPAKPARTAAPDHTARPEPSVADSIFISYRRLDSADVTGRIYDRLMQRFDREQVFKDVDSIPLGVDFRAHLGDVVGRCSLLLAVIGPQWLTAAGANGRRLDDAGDFVRIEIEAALARNIPVIPLLVGGAALPTESELPPSLAAITYRNGISVRPDPDFHRDMDRLVAGIESHQRR